MITIVTTCGRPTPTIVEHAKRAAEKLNILYKDRMKHSISQMMSTFNSHCLVLTKTQWEFYSFGQNTPYFFHPSSASFRQKRIDRGEHDPFLEACQLELGDSIIDCTFGYGSDSLIAERKVGQTGKVIAVEMNPWIAFIIQEIKKHQLTPYNEWLTALNNLDFFQGNAVDVLTKMESNSVDVVYLDPMFEEEISESNAIAPLREMNEVTIVSNDWIEQAKRVARRKVVVKAHFRSPLFAQFGFHQHIRPNTKFHFGTIEIK